MLKLQSWHEHMNELKAVLKIGFQSIPVEHLQQQLNKLYDYCQLEIDAKDEYVSDLYWKWRFLCFCRTIRIVFFKIVV